MSIVASPPRVGFLSVIYNRHGGVETWHQSLLQRLDNVVGFVCLRENSATGNFGALTCPTGIGPKAARELAANCDVLVVWGVGPELGDILPEKRPAVISVAHGDAHNQWTFDVMQSQSRWTDHVVYLSESAKGSVPTGIPSTLIPNAPDPTRVAPTQPRSVTRSNLGIGFDEKMILVASRCDPKKHIEKLVRAVNFLPSDFHLVVACYRQSWSEGYYQELAKQCSERTQIIDSVDRPGDLLAAADMAASASESEGYGLSVAEAMLAGVPVLTTPVGFIKEESEMAKTVSLDASPEDWATEIYRDFSDPPEQRKRTGLAKAFMQEKHSLGAQADSWNGLIASVATKAASAGQAKPAKKIAVTSIIPYRDRPDRRAAFRWVRQWHEHRADEVIVSEVGADETFNKSELVNRAAEQAKGDILVIGDADTVVCNYALREALEIAGERLILPFRSIVYLDERQSRFLRRRDPTKHVSEKLFRRGRRRAPRAYGLFWVVRRDVLLRTPMDEAFVEHGYQDRALHVALGKACVRLRGSAFHQNHVPNRVNQRRNEQYFNRYYRDAERKSA